MNGTSQTTIKLNKAQKFFLAIAKFQKVHWFVTLVVVRLSAIWFSLILTYAGEVLNLLNVSNQGKKLTGLGWATTIAMVIAILLFEAAKHVEANLNREPFEIGGFVFLNSLRKGIGALCDSKLNTLITQIENVKMSRCQPPMIVSNPLKQLQGIANQMVQCLSQLLAEKGDNRVRGKDIYATIAYQFPMESKDWHWATEEHGLGFDKLVAKADATNKSCFQTLLECGDNYVFHNRKQDAFQVGKYICDEYDKKDDKGELKGSIACYRFDIKKNDKVYVRAVLSITSYQQPFTSDNSKEAVNNVRENMDDFVISDFEKRIKIELCLLYLAALQAGNQGTT